MEIHFDRLNPMEFFQCGGLVIDKTGDVESVNGYIFEEPFYSLYKVNRNYLKDNANFECKIGYDLFEYDWKNDIFRNISQIKKHEVNIPKNDPYGMPNVCFSLVDECDDDERKVLFRQQRIERGFDDSELWNLDYTFIKFMFPRLKALRDYVCAYPGMLNNLEEWQEILDKIINAFDIYLNKECDMPTCTSQDIRSLEYIKRAEGEAEYNAAVERWKQFHEGWDLFHKWFFWFWD